MKKADWVWMPHAGHFILGDRCRFHLNTYVGNHIISTVGELWSERAVREIHAKIDDPQWLMKNNYLLGDDFDRAYMKKFGFEEVGCGRKYETMVFRSKKSEHKCCPYVMSSPSNIDFAGYNSGEDAVLGHMKFCNKWANRRENDVHRSHNPQDRH